MSVELPVLASVFLTSLLAGAGALFLVLSEEEIERILVLLVSLSTGAIFGSAFIHLVPRYVRDFGFTHMTGLLVLAGVAGSHLMEKAVHWHCHRTEHEVEPYSYMILAGDSLHNFIDGILVASSYLVSLNAGVAATVAVMLHKIPKELGDFGTLVSGGFSRGKALAFNLLVSVFMFAGAAGVLAASNVVGVEKFLVPLTVGNFVYVGGTDLFPEIKHPDEEASEAAVFAVFLSGIALTYLVTLL
ncbi:MAG: ZIP family metal transporter [Candidatus Nanohaloarchaea archaeon]